MKLDLPYPHKALWPNGRAHWGTRATETKKHRQWAHQMAYGQRDRVTLGDGKVPVRITVHGKASGPLPDADNASAAAKAYLDGIASALGVNDRTFAAPIVEYGSARTARFIVEIGL